MPHFRLCYRDSSQRFNVTVVEARSLIHARLRAVLAGHGGMIFTEGQELGAEMAPLVQPGHVLSADEAMDLFRQLEPNPANRIRGNQNVTARRFPPPWSVIEHAARYRLIATE
jgi:hypothetical protein